MTGDGPRCLVVMYHYVHDRDPLPRRVPGALGTDLFGLTAEQFTSQIEHLCRVMEPIHWPALYASLRGRRSMPHRCFLLTFDDGLADHARTVLPILDQHRLRGVFFVPGAALVSHRLLPAHAIHLLLATLDEETLEQALLAYLADQGDRGLDWNASFSASAAEAMYGYETPARARLKYFLTAALPVALRNAAVEALFQQHIGSATRWARHWYLNWEDLTRMQSSGHTIGGHGFAHEPYGRLTPQERRQDLRRVAAVLQSGLGPDRRPFSYPYGQFDDDACTACREAGFVHAFTTQRQWVASNVDPFRLPRVDTIHVNAMLKEEEALCPRS